MSHNSVTAIYQDKFGLVWVGTYDGLNRYDGHSFKIFRHRLNDTGSIINNRVTAIAEDSENRIWVATKKGLSVWSGITQRFMPVYYQPHNASNTKLPVDMMINEILADGRGNILIGASKKGLLLYEKQSHHIVQVPLVTGKKNERYDFQVQGIRKDGNNNIWIVIAGSGLCRLNYKTKNIIPVNNFITSCSVMEVDKNNNIWMAWGCHIYEYRTATDTCIYHGRTSAIREDVLCLMPGKDGRLWVGTDGSGIHTFKFNVAGNLEPAEKCAFMDQLNSNAVSTLYEDRQGNTWIGTLRGGINFIGAGKRSFASLTRETDNLNSLIGNYISAFEQDNEGRLWIGTDGSGISIWNRKKNSLSHFTHENSTLASNLITNIHKTSDGNIWVATYGNGIDLFDKRSGRFINYQLINHEAATRDMNVWTLYEDRFHTLWAGTVTGSLYTFNKSTNSFEVFDKKLQDILCMGEDREGNLWAGNFESLVQVDRLNKKHQYFDTENPVRVIHEDKQGTLWVGTEGSGLLSFNKSSRKFTAFTDEDGLANNAVINMLEDRSGYLWLSTFNGLSRLNPNTHHFKNFFESDGLLSNQFIYNAAFPAPSGELFFGGLKGVNFFYPDSVTMNYRELIPLITDIRFGNASIATDSSAMKGHVMYTMEELTLPYKKAVLSIDFTAPEFNYTDQVSYAYYLEGKDKEWIYSGKSRTATYSDLPEGHYKLHIRSTNAGGIWDNKERVIAITVLPPWFRSWWMYLLYLGAAAGVIIVCLRYNNKQLQLSYEVQLANVKAERESEMNRKKQEFFTHVAHEFRTPITLIINPIKALLDTPGAAKETDLKIVYHNSKRLLSLVDQLLLFKKAENGGDDLRVVKLNLAEVCREVFLCFTQQAAYQGLHYTFEADNGNIGVWGDREKIEIAVFNLLSNALKFTPAGGAVKLKLEETDNTAAIFVEDTGCGIPEKTGMQVFERFNQVKEGESASKTGFGIGLFLVRNFIESHKGQVSYTSKPGEGTSFCMMLKKGNAHFSPEQLVNMVVGKSPILEELNVTTVKLNAGEPPIEMESLANTNSAATLISENNTILLVDDNEDIRLYLKQIFQDNFRVIEAHNGREGLRLAKLHLPDIIISDVVMDEMTGLEFCAAVKEEPSLQHIQLILLTASTSAENKLKGLECGADDYITKPFERDILIARVTSLLKNRNNLQKYFYNEVTLRKSDFTVSEEYKNFMENCIYTVEKHLDRDDFNIKLFAKEMGMSHSSLYKKVKQVSGQSINSFVRFIRLRKAAELLISTSDNVNEVAFQVGISDSKYFRIQFAKQFGMNPSDYKKKYHTSFSKNYALPESMVRTQVGEEV
ncbi:hybrid sensor histidine kinase/response regulator [Filimonas effusa]|uniref:hybrid sensor histidine kinase/response regulator n=1 Tax=Filimonas effusa TaxID=2508721 RepID=UPI0013E952EB|nr:two-component regulator propeller domain-containing protein [Filimonas effusa]